MYPQWPRRNSKCCVWTKKNWLLVCKSSQWPWSVLAWVLSRNVAPLRLRHQSGKHWQIAWVSHWQHCVSGSARPGLPARVDPGLRRPPAAQSLATWTWTSLCILWLTGLGSLSGTIFTVPYKTLCAIQVVRYVTATRTARSNLQGQKWNLRPRLKSFCPNEPVRSRASC